MGDMSPCKHGNFVGYCSLCDPTWEADLESENAKYFAHIERKRRYDAIFELLSKADLASRNGEWATCGTYALSCSKLAFEFYSEKQTLSVIGGPSK